MVSFNFSTWKHFKHLKIISQRVYHSGTNFSDTFNFLEIPRVFKKVSRLFLNNEWNVHFIRNMRCIQKASWLKHYLPRQKWTMNETFILFEIWGVFKKYRDWSCIYQDRNEQWIKRWFSLKYEMCWKSIETEVVFTNTEMNNAVMNAHFIQNTRCVQKVSWLTQYLTRQKWTKNEIFSFKYSSCYSAHLFERVFISRSPSETLSLDIVWCYGVLFFSWPPRFEILPLRLISGLGNEEYALIIFHK